MKGGYSDSWILYSGFFISLYIIHKKRANYKAPSYLWRFPLVKLKGLIRYKSKKPPDFRISITSENRGAEWSVSHH